MLWYKTNFNLTLNWYAHLIVLIIQGWFSIPVKSCLATRFRCVYIHTIWICFRVVYRWWSKSFIYVCIVYMQWIFNGKSIWTILLQLMRSRCAVGSLSSKNILNSRIVHYIGLYIFINTSIKYIYSKSIYNIPLYVYIKVHHQ